MAVVFSSEQQCIYIKFESYRKKNAREIHVALQEVCGNSVISYLQVARWANPFHNGRDRVKDSEEKERSEN